MKKAPALATTKCPRCGQEGPIRLAVGQVCAVCASAEAWSRQSQLVITRDEIADAVARRDHEARRSPVPEAHAAASAILAGVAGYYLIALFWPLALTGLQELVDAMQGIARQATLIGAAGLAAGVFGLWILRRGRHFHRRLLLASHLACVLAGTLVLIVGGFQWWGLSKTTMDHLSMPALHGPGQSPASIDPLDSPDSPADPDADPDARASNLLGYRSMHFERIARATTVVLAADKDGDARNVAIGTGAIISRTDDRAWIVTCAHVAMPYASTAAHRTPDDARPVWIELFDGRGAPGEITWLAPPPLDVALVRVEIDSPPEAIRISPQTSAITSGDPVMFVPNPYRDGWMIHHGSVETRRHHDTPAGTYGLLYTDLPVQKGDSGSGLFDSRGMLIGLNTWTRIGDSAPHGISLPSEAMRAIAATVNSADGSLGASLDDHFPPSGSKR